MAVKQGSLVSVVSHTGDRGFESISLQRGVGSDRDTGEGVTIASLFTEDAVWESPALGRFEGREAIRSFFQGASGIFSFAIHYSLNGHIEVEGDTARARWYLFMPCTVAAGNQAVWRAGIDHETYARVDGTWMFRHKRSGLTGTRCPTRRFSRKSDC